MWKVLKSALWCVGVGRPIRTLLNDGQLMKKRFERINTC